MIEEAPQTPVTSDVLEILMNEELSRSVSKMNEEYLYWDKVKYQVPKGLKAEDFWNAVKYSRRLETKSFKFSACAFFIKETSSMQEALHNFDMNFGGTLASTNIISEKCQRRREIS